MTAGQSGERLPSGMTLISYESVGSTNDIARELALSGADHGTIVQAGEQLGGRGRNGRFWASPPGNLYTSIIFRPEKPISEVTQVTFVAALAVADLVSWLVPTVTPKIKWPNDVLIEGRKISGILLETVTGPENDLQAIILGVGINVRGHPNFPDRPATCLGAHLPTSPVLHQVLEAYAESLWRNYNLWHRDGFTAIRNAWLARAGGIGEDVVVRLAKEEFSGKFETLDAHGGLVLGLANGERRVITAGDVFLTGS